MAHKRSGLDLAKSITTGSAVISDCCTAPSFHKKTTTQNQSFRNFLTSAKMTKQVLINLAVKDLAKSMDFYTALGFVTQFSDETAKRMVWTENISVMIMTQEKFRSF